MTSAGRVRVWIDEACIGSGQCELVDPQRFSVGDDGIAVVLGDPEIEIGPGDPESVLDVLRAAADNCPIGAIHVDEIA